MARQIDFWVEDARLFDINKSRVDPYLSPVSYLAVVAHPFFYISDVFFHQPILSFGNQLIVSQPQSFLINQFLSTVSVFLEQSIRMCFRARKHSLVVQCYTFQVHFQTHEVQFHASKVHLNTCHVHVCSSNVLERIIRTFKVQRHTLHCYTREIQGLTALFENAIPCIGDKGLSPPKGQHSTRPRSLVRVRTSSSDRLTQGNNTMI